MKIYTEKEAFNLSNITYIIGVIMGVIIGLLLGLRIGGVFR